MTREGALLVMIGVAVLLVAIGVFAWWRRTRRDATLVAPVGELPDGARTTYSSSGFYVATTRHGEPLERLAIARLGFRSRADVTVTERGVALDLVGQPRIVLGTDRLVSAELATVAIDRVVEPGGLVRLVWNADRTDGTREQVDSYLRPQDGSARALATAIAATLQAPSTSTTPPTTGTHA
jgi:hypothetical protein